MCNIYIGISLGASRDTSLKSIHFKLKLVFVKIYKTSCHFSKFFTFINFNNHKEVVTKFFYEVEWFQTKQ